MVEVETAVLLLRIGMRLAVDDVEAAMEAEAALLCATAAVVSAATFLTLSNYRVEGKKSVRLSHVFCVMTTYLSAQISIDATDAKAFFGNFLRSTAIVEAGTNSLGVRVVIHCC